jgi:Na+-transporting NADH:ubiquinone oxidoreductase subunit D
MANKPWQSFLDRIGNAPGYGAILIIVSFFREFLGSGTVFGIQLIEPLGLYELGYVDNGVMLTPAAAMFVIGVIIWVQRSRNKKLIDVS